MLESGANAPGNPREFFFPTFEEVSVSEATLLGAFEAFLEFEDYPDDLQVAVRNRDVADIAVRVLKREEYYRHFHGIEISETKRTALFAYWVVKLRPFTVVDSRFQENDTANFVNERFAAFLLVNQSCLTLKDDDMVNTSFRSDYLKKLVYSFRYRNLGIDAFVLLAEGLTPASFEQQFGETF